MSNKIFFISRDPGGTNQLVALRDIILGPDDETRTTLFECLNLSHVPNITVIAKDYAKIIWKQNEVAFDDWPNIKTEGEITKYLAGLSPNHIITGTSHVDDRTEQTVWQASKQLGIKTTCFLDAGDNIALRFTDNKGEIILPDRVSMINNKARNALLSLGLSEKDIFISGDLYHGYAKSKVNKKCKLRTEWGAKDTECLILFASDYIREMQEMGVVFEVTEFEALHCLIDLVNSGDISKYIKGAIPPIRLIIRPHPKDSPGKYDSYPQKDSEKLTIMVSDIASSIDAVQSVNMVAGLGSSLMSEARMLGVDVLKLEPIVKSRKDH